MSELSTSGAIGIGTSVAAASTPSSVGLSAEGGLGAGIGFDNGSPTFSGLGRSDSFSGSEGPKGPVSFTNSVDLFAETKTMTPLDTSSMEKAPANFSGDIFANTEVVDNNLMSQKSSDLSQTPNLGIFKDTISMSAVQPISERAVPSFVLNNTAPIWENTEKSHFGLSNENDRMSNVDAIASLQHDNKIVETEVTNINPEAETETIIAEYISHHSGTEDLSAETINQAIDDVRSESPVAFTQIEGTIDTASEVELVSDNLNIQPEISQAVTDALIGDAIAETGINEEVESAVESISDSQAETEELAEAQTQAQAEQEALVATEEAETSEELTQQQARAEERRLDNVIDEKANKAREEEIISSARKIIAESENGVTEIDGRSIVEIMPDEPTSPQISGLIHQEGGKDGSYNPMLHQLGQMRFTSDDQVFAAAKQVVADNTAVEKNVTGIQAKAAEIEKVKRGAHVGKEIEVYPIAA